MAEGISILSSSDLMLTFLSHTSAHNVKYLGGLNPFTVKVDGEVLFIYIRNLSPAQLSNNNPDVWRIQLPMRDDFEMIKESAYLFILLGYDKENDVYTTWNPYWCKQRLNVGKSVSLYSRLSLQQRVHVSNKIEKMLLNNDGDVVCIPGYSIYEYLKNINYYYPEETVFVAKNSSLQSKTNDHEIEETRADSYYELDEYGKIVALDEDLVKLLIPYTKEEYPDYEAMQRIAENFYSQDVIEKMNPFDWIHLFENLKKVKKGKSRKKREKTKNLQSDYISNEIVTNRVFRKVTILRVQFPDGNIVQYPSATDTYVEIIDNNYPDLIEEIDFGYPVLSKEKLPDFKSTKRAQKQLKNGYYLSTNFDTETKANILRKVSEELGLNLKIDVVDKYLDDTPNGIKLDSIKEKVSISDKTINIQHSNSDFNNDLQDYHIDIKGNRCALLDSQYRTVFSSSGRIIRFGRDFYSIKITYYDITINLLKKDDQGMFMLGDPVIYANFRSPLYANVNIKNCLEQIKEIKFNNRSKTYYVRVGEKWYNKKGEFLALEDLKGIDESTMEKSNQKLIVQKDSQAVTTHKRKIIELGERSIAIIGDTEQHRNELKAIGGCYTDLPKWGTVCVFPSKMLKRIQAYVAGNVSALSSWEDNRNEKSKKKESLNSVSSKEEQNDLKETILGGIQSAKSGEKIVDQRIGNIVKMYPSQKIGKIIGVRTDIRGSKKLIIKTTKGDLYEVYDSTYFYEILKRTR